MYLFGVYFMIIDDNGDSLIGNEVRMNEIRDQISPIFGGRKSNFAFKCNRCKDYEERITLSNATSAHTMHDNSIQVNNTVTMEHNNDNVSCTNTNVNAVGSDINKNNASKLNLNAVTSDKSAEFSNSNAVGSDKSAEGSNKVQSHDSATKIDDSLSIHVSKFKPNTNYMDVANFITEKTSLEFKTSFSVFKLHQRKFNKAKPTFVSFKIKAEDKDVFDTIMSTELWEPDFKASPYDRSISKAKALERRSKFTSRKLEAPQSNFNADSKHGKQKNQPQKSQQPHKLDKPQPKKPHKKQQQQPKRQQKPQQQQQQPNGRQKKDQQQQPQRRKIKQQHQRRGNQHQRNGKNFNGTPHPGNFNPYQGSNFHPNWLNNQAPPINTFNRRDQLFNILQQFFAQQPQN